MAGKAEGDERTALLADGGEGGRRSKERASCGAALCAWVRTVARCVGQWCEAVLGHGARKAAGANGGTSVAGGGENNAESSAGKGNLMLFRTPGGCFSVEAAAAVLEARLKPMLDETSTMFIDVVQLHNLRTSQPATQLMLTNPSPQHAAIVSKTQTTLPPQKIAALVSLLSAMDLPPSTHPERDEGLAHHGGGPELTICASYGS